MIRPQVVLFGDSHIDAVRRAIKLRMMAAKPAGFDAYRLARVKNNQVIGDMAFDDAIRLIGELSTDDIVLSFMGGNQHAVLSTIQHPKPFDFQLAGRQNDFRQDAEIIPYNVLKDYISSGVEGKDGERLKAFRRATVARLYHVIPPPPKESTEHILQHHETHFADQEILVHGISPASLRYKAWELQARILEEFCGANGLTALRPPAEAVTPDGFLAPDFYAQDATHGNPAYGELVLRVIDDLARNGDEG